MSFQNRWLLLLVSLLFTAVINPYSFFNSIFCLVCMVVLVISTICVTFDLQEGITPFRLAVEKERSKMVKYFVEEIKVDTTLYDQVIIIILYIYIYIHTHTHIYIQLAMHEHHCA